MSFLSMMEAKLPPGFRFHPRDEELICDYLAKRLSGDNNGDMFPAMVDVDLNKCEPWDLPETACVGGKEWYFFSLRDRKYATGQRTNRATVSGYWKATGKDRQVAVDSRRRRGAPSGGAGDGGGPHHHQLVVGMRKTLVFYQGRAPKGKKTDWVMHEFRMEGPTTGGGGGGSGGCLPPPPPPPSAADFSSSKEDWVLCRVFYKSRSLSTKTASFEHCYDDSRDASSSLPSLMESTFINFGQAPLDLEGYEQVPCFSSLPAISQSSQGLMPPTSSTLIHPMGAAGLPTNIGLENPGGFLPHMSFSYYPFLSEKKDVKAILDHLTKLESNSEGSSKGYLTDQSCVPSMWNPF